jgi:hypothetical protein
MPSVATTPAIRQGFKPSRSSAIKTSTTKTQKHRTAKNAKKDLCHLLLFHPLRPLRLMPFSLSTLKKNRLNR